MRKIAVMAVLLSGVGAVWLTMAMSASNGGQGETMVVIERGASVKKTARTLYISRVISSPLLFEIEVRLKGYQGKIKAGEYMLSRNLSIKQVADRLAEGRTALRSVTIREGLSVRQTAQALENAGIVKADDFVMSADLLARDHLWNIPADSLEGYLFPDTYRFSKGVSVETVARAMVELFYRKAGSVAPAEVMNDPVKLHKLVTLASLVEKETGADNERALIAGVFAKRLEKNMLLQSDPTVIYALPSFDGNLRKKDLLYDSPYNTYKYRGLPPGPIASPGLASIKAALHPARVNYIYFVSKNNGEHYFSTTLKEHNQAVKRYQGKIRRK